MAEPAAGDTHAEGDIEGGAPAAAELATNDEVLVDLKQVDELITRLTAVRGSLKDHLDDNQILFEGVPAALDFVDRICQKIKGYILGEGSGPLQNILVLDVGKRLHEIDLSRHFTHDNMQAKIRQMNGYQTHLMAPETAVEGVISDAFQDVTPVVTWMVEAVRRFLREMTQQAGASVAADDPQKREQLANMIVEATEEVFDAWQKEAEAMAAVVMDMERTIMSPVFWRRLTYIRKQQALHGDGFGRGDGTLQGRAVTQLRSARDAAGGFFGNMYSKLGRKGGPSDGGEGTAPGRQGPGRTAPSRRSGAGGVKALLPARRSAAAAADEAEALDDDEDSSVSGVPLPPVPGAPRPPNRTLAAVGHIPNWSVGHKKLNLKTGPVMYLVGKLKKKSHAKMQVGSAWKERFFAYSDEHAELYYWRKQPTPETAENPVIVVYMPDAKVTHATLQELSGLDKQFEGNTYLGLRIDARIKDKHDEIIIAFETAADKKRFGDALGSAASSTRAAAITAAAAKPRAAPAAPVDDDGDEDDDEDAPATPDNNGNGDGGGGSGEFSGGEDEEGGGEVDEPLTPTRAYSKGGLGMGSKYFAADDAWETFGTERAPTSHGDGPLRNIGEDRALMARDRVDTQEAVELLASDASVYVTIVTDSISASLPKVAVMNMVERILTGELMKFLQKRVLEWPAATTDTITACSAGPLSASAKDATNWALRDIEHEMVAVRMSAQSASLAGALRPQDALQLQCPVSVHALSLGGYGKLLSAHNKGDARSLMMTRYGEFFPIQALEAADAAAAHQQAVKALTFDRTRAVQTNDPLMAPHGEGWASHTVADGADAMRKAGSSVGGSVASMVSMTKHMIGKSMAGRRSTATDADVDAEHESMDAAAAAAAPRRGGAAFAAAPAAPAPAVRASFGGDPLGGGGFGGGGDPLAGGSSAVSSRDPMYAQKMAAAAASGGGDDEDSDEETDAAAAADARYAARLARGNAAAAPAAAPARAAPGPPRRAAPAPSRAAPPARPAPLRAPPVPVIGGAGRPGPVSSRPAPMGAPMAPRAGLAMNPLQNSAGRAPAPPRPATASQLPL